MMNRIPTVRPWSVDNSKQEYTAFIATVGYERRARHIAETLGVIANEKLACAFPDRKIHHYNDNLRWFHQSGYLIEEVLDEAFRTWCENTFKRLRSNKLSKQYICIDVSSLNRFRIAVLIDTIRKLDWDSSIQVDFLYSLAEYSPPNKGTTLNRFAGPVLPSFAGWTTEPDRPPIAVVGLGYEQDQALGAVEHIQAASVWAFLPESPIAKYADAVNRANQILLEAIPPARQLTYQVHQPFNCFVLLESLTHRILSNSSPIIFPFGPKVFTVCSLLVGCLYPSVAVWRVSAGAGGVADDRKPSEFIYGLTVDFIPAEKKIEQGFDSRALVSI
jgi:hypothetical protein